MSLKIPVGNDDHVLGRADAPQTLLEYGDYECPYCREAHVVIKSVRASLGDRLRFVFRNMPLNEVHPHAELAAEAAEAAAAQGKFWQMHDALFEHNPPLSSTAIASLARRLQLDLPRFQDDLATHRFRARVQQDFLGAIKSGATGTPAFFIDGELYGGAAEEDALIAALQGMPQHRRAAASR
jgi:protein-disulfide isomerase